MIDYDKRSAVRTAKKRCSKCGQTSWVKPTERKCKRQKMGRISYWCYGDLTTVARKKPKALVPIPDGVGLGYVLTEEYQRQAEAAKIAAFRKRAQQRLVKTKSKLVDAEHAVLLAERLVTRRLKLAANWARRLATAERMTQLSDAEIFAQSARIRTATQVRSARARMKKAAGLIQKRSR